MRNRIYNIGSGLLCYLAGVMLFGLMVWHVYEADDLSTALMLFGAMMAMVLREAYHLWREDHVRRRRK